MTLSRLRDLLQDCYALDAELRALIADMLAAMRAVTTHPTTVTLTGREAQWAMRALGLGDLTAARITIDLTPAPAPASAGRRTA